MERAQRAAAALLGSAVLALAGVEASAAPAGAAAKKKVVTKKLVGKAVQADRWGDVAVTITIRITRSATGKTTRRYVDLGGHYSFHTSRSEYIMSQALPLLRREFLEARSADVQVVTGATDTSEAFIESLQSALLERTA
jgi:hypothetical protein